MPYPAPSASMEEPLPEGAMVMGVEQGLLPELSGALVDTLQARLNP